MESFVGLVIVIAVIAALIFFKGIIKKAARYGEDVINTNISEASIELIQRSQEAYNTILEEFGEDFKTPEELYKLIHRQGRKRSNNNNNNVK